MPLKRSRKNIAAGLRVKVRFATKVKRDGKIIRKKKWYGGRVSAVSKEGSKIRIKYDDGTTEVTRFPDKDVVVDDTGNGQHHAPSEKFVPPLLLGSKDDELDQDESQQHHHQQQHHYQASAQQYSSTQHYHEDEDEEEEKEEKAESHLKARSSLSSSSKHAKSSLVHTSVEHGSAHTHARSTKNVADSANMTTTGAAATVTTTTTAAATTESIPPAERKRPSQDSTSLSESQPQQLEEGDEAPKPKRKRGRPPKNRPPGALLSPKRLPSKEKSPADEPAAKDGDSSHNTATMDVDATKASQETNVPPTVSTTPVTTNADQGGETTSLSTQPIIPTLLNKPTDTSALSSSAAMSEEPSKEDALRTHKPVAGDATNSSEQQPTGTVAVAAGTTEGTVENKFNTANGDTTTLAITETGSAIEPTEPLESVKSTRQPSITIRIPKLVSEPAKDVVSVGETPVAAENQPIVVETGENTLTTSGDVQLSNPTQPGDRKPVVPKSAGSVSENADTTATATTTTTEDRKSNTDDEDKSSVDKTLLKRLHIHIPVGKMAKKEETGTLKNERDLSTSPPVKKRIREKDLTGPDNVVAPLLEQGPVENEPRPKKQKRKRIEDAAGLDSQVPKRKSFESIDSMGSGADHSKRSPKTSRKIIETETIKPAVFGAQSLQMTVGGDVDDVSRASPTDPDPTEGSTEDGISSAPEDVVMDDDGGASGKALTPRSRPFKGDLAPIVRSGRRAAQQANERISSRQEVVIEKENALSKKKKKRDRKNGEPEDHSESSEDDSQWVQCDKCKKWRIIPTIVVASLPTQWFCQNNEWDPKRASCDAPEQTAKQAAKERKRRKKLQRRLRLEAAAAENAEMNEITKEKVADTKPRKEERSKSPVPPRGVGPEVSSKPRKPSPSCMEPAEPTPVTAAPPPKKILGKKARAAETSDTTVAAAPGESECKPRGRGRPRRNNAQGTTGSKPASTPAVRGNTDEADNLEWVQCEKCLKWRKLPAHISADELPDTWYCSMNYWSPASASCDAPEDKADGLQDIGFHAGNGAGKLSYRSLIFGQTGRKAHRPVSERARAAESLFVTPNDDEDAPPTVMYANSTNFVPRGRPSVASDENRSMSVLELMSHSNLWAELRRAAQPYSNHTSNGVPLFRPNPAHFTYDILPINVKGSFRELLLHSLGDDCLTGDQLLLTMLNNATREEPEGWAAARSYASINVVVTAVYELVKEGLVDCIQKMGSDSTIDPCNLRYRRSRRLRVADNIQPESLEAREKSRCMKISKPWKR